MQSQANLIVEMRKQPSSLADFTLENNQANNVYLVKKTWGK